MIYLPTVFDDETKKRHIVMDQNRCLCGIKYNAFATFTRNDLKKIRFKPEVDINCPTCRSIIE